MTIQPTFRLYVQIATGSKRSKKTTISNETKQSEKSMWQSKTRRLTCGYVNGFDDRDTLSLPAGGVGARAGAVATGRALFITLLAFFILLSFSQPNSYAWKNHSMNLKLYAHNQIKDWSEFECYVELIHRESTWNYKARNGSHYGLGQMRSTWYRDLTPRKQIKAHLDYIEHRYEGSACKALRHLIRKGWH